MRILAFESSAKAASVALTEDGVLLGESFLNNGKTHSEPCAHGGKAAFGLRRDGKGP